MCAEYTTIKYYSKARNYLPFLCELVYTLFLMNANISPQEMLKTKKIETFVKT
jgi:hypothetical protein